MNSYLNSYLLIFFKGGFFIKPISFLGPKGTYTHEAASIISDNLVSYCTIPAVLASVADGECDKGVVPIENSIEGSVSQTLDLFAHKHNLKILEEIIIPINHNLIVNKGVKLDEIKDIYSHSQALGQCQGFINENNFQPHFAISTANAVKSIIGNNSSAAIGNKKAAELYDMDILISGIQDVSNNETRFVVVSKNDHEPTGKDKTSIVFSLYEDNPGDLYKILEVFYKSHVNLTKIESRPSKEGLGNYIFFLDFYGHRKDDNIDKILTEIEKTTATLKIFGSYPVFI